MTSGIVEELLKKKKKVDLHYIYKRLVDKWENDHRNNGRKKISSLLRCLPLALQRGGFRIPQAGRPVAKSPVQWEPLF